MKYYTLKRRPDGTTEAVELAAPSSKWDDDEEAKLEALAEGARKLVRDTHRPIDPAKSAEVRQALIKDVLTAR